MNEGRHLVESEARSFVCAMNHGSEWVWNGPPAATPSEVGERELQSQG